MLYSNHFDNSDLTALVTVNGQVVDWDQCFCPGTEYAIYYENVTYAIARALRINDASVYRLPILPKPNIPNIEILAGIAKFATYNRSQLLSIGDTDLIELAEEGQEQAVKANDSINRSLEMARLNYEGRREEIIATTQNMTAKWDVIAAAQAAIIDASGGKRRKRQGAIFNKHQLYCFQFNPILQPIH